MKKLLPLLFLSLIVVMPFAAAQFYYAYMNPSDLLDNPWFIFTVFFAVFFGVIYTSLGRVIGGTTPALVASAAISFLISAGVQKNWYFWQQPIMFWAVALIVVLILMTFIKILIGGGGVSPWIFFGVLLLFWGIWPFIKNLLPIGAIESMPYGLIEFLNSTWLLALIVVIIGFIIRMSIRGYGYYESLRHGRQPYGRQ